MNRLNSKILYVDDEEINLVNFSESLNDEFTIFTSTSGEEALKILEVEGEMALVVSDQRMPGMSGTEFLTLVKERFPESIRMIISAYTEIEELMDAINRAEVYRYLVKPWEEEQLRLTIRNAVGTYALGQEIKLIVDQGRRRIAKRVAELNKGNGKL